MEVHSLVIRRSLFVVVVLAGCGVSPKPLFAQIMRPGGGTISAIGSPRSVTSTSGPLTTLTVSNSAIASAGQRCLLRVRRDLFRRGGWDLASCSPAGYAVGDAVLPLPIGDQIPPGSRIQSAVIVYSNGTISAVTNEFSRTSRVHGATRPCSQGPCTPASIKSWATGSDVWADRLQLDTLSPHQLTARHNYPGSIDLLKLYPGNSLMGRRVTLFGRVQSWVGRPYFATEGVNADSDFQILSRAEVTVTATLVVTYTSPPPCNFAISPTSQTVSATGGRGQIEVTAPSGCSWSASAVGPITMISGSSSSGTGTVAFSVPPNPAPSRRFLSMIVAGRNVSIEQEPASKSAPTWRIAKTDAPAGLYVKSGWARSPSAAFVWGSRTLKNSVVESYLLKWDGTSWREVFFLANASAISVFGAGKSDVFVSAFYTPNGPTEIYRSNDDGATWMRLPLPANIAQKWVGNLSGSGSCQRH